MQRRQQQFEYLIVLDFEATCFTESADPDEIIEWPAMIIDTRQKCVLDNYFHFFIKPRINPILSSQCIELTGIKQEIISNSSDIVYVINKWNEFCYLNNLFSNNSCIVICGNWDLKIMWPMQSKIINNQSIKQIHYSILHWFRNSISKSNQQNKQIPSELMDLIKLFCTDSLISKPVLFDSWINIKHLYHEIYNKRVNGMKDILYQFCISHEGHYHSGFDDVTNICSIVLYMLNKEILFIPTFTNCNDITVECEMQIRQMLEIKLGKNKRKMLMDKELMKSFCIGENICNYKGDIGGIIEIGIESQIFGKKTKKKKIVTIVNGINPDILEKYGIKGLKSKQMSRILAKEFATTVGYRKLSKLDTSKVLIINGNIPNQIAKFLRSKWNIPTKFLYYKINGSLTPCFY